MSDDRVPMTESRWRRRAGLLRALFRAAWLVDLQYRAAILIWMSWSVLDPLISLGIWWSIAGAGSVGGYERSDFARYFFGVTLINQLTMAWDAYYIDRWIRNGEINYRLARPIPPIVEAVCDNLAYKARTATLIAIIWGVVAIAWPAVRLELTPGRVALTLVATLLAGGIRFLNGYATGLLAFWTTRASALSELQWGISLFLSGRLAPLSLFPPLVGTIAGVLWFRYTLSFPVEVLTGAIVAPDELARGFLGQIVWLAIWYGVYRLVWTRGIRRYGAVGG
jgi:ABC-2 type transport system permease protein